jgi:hypothetical protein
MRRDLEESLFAVEPGWFDRERGAMAFGFEHGDGWHGIVKGLLDLAARRRAEWPGPVDENPFAPGRFAVRQCKEKLGVLRLYHVGGDADFRAAVARAEEQSARTCEECGAEGRRGPAKRGRVRTLCDAHRPSVPLP